MEEKFEGYKMTFKFNASHSLSDETKKHAHTFLVRLYIQKDTKDFVEFFEYEIQLIIISEKLLGLSISKSFNIE